MKKLVFLCAVAATSAILPGAASAGVYSDDFARCLVSAASPQDQTTLMQWMFAAVSTNPAFQSMVKLTDADRENYDKQVAGLFQRLVLKDCRAQAVTALKYEGETAMLTGFQTLGQVAGRSLMGSPAASAELAKVTKYLDISQFQALGKEAGEGAPTK